MPPEEAEYHLIVPELAVAPTVTKPLSHLEPGVVLVIKGKRSTVAVTAVLAEVQALFVASA